MSETYDYFINEYDKSVKECNDNEDFETCKKVQIMNLLKSQYGSSFTKFVKNYNAFNNQLYNGDDLDVWEKSYNKLYKKMQKDKSRLNKEISELDDLIRVHKNKKKNYKNMLENRNVEVEDNIEIIDNKSGSLDTINENIKINKDGKELIYLFGHIPLTPYPMKSENVLHFYQIIIVILLILLILFIKGIKNHGLAT